MTPNAMAMVLARMWSALTTVAILAIVARTRSGDELGAVALGLSVGLALAVLPDGGLTSLFIREASRRHHRTGSLLGAVLVVRAVSLPTFVIFAWVLVANAFPVYATAIVVIALNQGIQQVGELARAAFISRGRMFVAAGLSALENLLWLVATGAALLAGVDLVASFAIGAVTLAIVDTGGFVLVRRLLHVSPLLPSRQDMITLVRDARSFAIFSTLAVLAARADIILIGLLLPTGLVAVGAYYAAARLVEAAEYLPDAVTRSVYPALSRQFLVDPKRMRELLAPGAKMLVTIGIAVPFGLALVGEFVLNILYGTEIARFEWLLVALGGVIPFKYAATLFGTVLTSSDAQGRRAKAMAAGLMATIVINLVLLPRLGLVAAVVATYAQWLLVVTFYTREVDPRVRSVFSVREIIGSLVLAAAAFGVGLAVQATGVPGAVPLSGIVFGVLVTLRLFWPAIRAARERRRSSAPGDRPR